jgi:tRNA(Arg) A34 adenosine deaminase TadA
MIDPSELMRLAISKAREGITAGQSPFGCAIACGDELVAVAHNVVRATTDITAHAEITAIRVACQRLHNIHLCDCIVATTCEPCPMCMSALHWARVDTVFYGAGIADASLAGFNELGVPAEKLIAFGGSTVKLVPGVMRPECQELFQEWLRNPDRLAY